MNIQSIKLVCFSPTGTTKAVIRSIARGINQTDVELIDITRPDVRNKPLRTSENELLVVGVPVYMGRVPALLSDWFHSLEANNTPAVCVVVYGNRAYENSLLELKDLMVERGCVSVAGAAYIGEHSFSSPELPSSEGRPDKEDLEHAEIFGRKINEKLSSVSSINEMAEIEVPGSFPYEGITKLWSVDFIAVGNECIQCGICAEVCPVGAVDPEASNVIDIEKCITCCACIKNCPEKARTMKNGPVKDAAMRVNKLFNDPRDPDFFL